MLYKDSVSLIPLIQGMSSCFAATESCAVCTFSWMVYWQSCEMSRPFDPLLFNMMVGARCSYYFSDFGVGSHVLSHLNHTKVVLLWKRKTETNMCREKQQQKSVILT